MIEFGDNLLALMAPVFTIYLGAVFLACWSRLRHATYLLWIGAGYILPSLALGAQTMMGGEQLAKWAVVCGTLYLSGTWFVSEGLARRSGFHLRPQIAIAVIAGTLALLLYYSVVVDELWIRALWLNIGILTLQVLPLRRLFSLLPTQGFQERILCWSYAFCALMTLGRIAVVLVLIPDTQDADELASSTYWKIILFSLWFVCVFLTAILFSVITSLRDERDHDPLTGVLNRRAFHERAQYLLEARGGHVLIACDIDHFKRVNDTYGHDIGDQVLRETAQLLKDNVRKGDLIARFGGEEFIVLLANADVSMAGTIAERIRQQLSRTRFIADRVCVTASFGISAVASVADLSDALRLADISLYQAKAEGRDRISVAASTIADADAS